MTRARWQRNLTTWALMAAGVWIVGLVGCSSDSSGAEDLKSVQDVPGDLAGNVEVAADQGTGTLDVPRGDDLQREPEVTAEVVPDVPVEPEVAREAVPEAVVIPDFPLKVGDRVPDFTLPAHDGTDFVLSAHKGKKVLISAFPIATTGVCTIQTCWVSDHYDEFVALNTFPVGLSTDGLGVLAQWVIDAEYKQLLLSDAMPKGEVSTMFGIYEASMGLTSRSNLIIDEEGILVFKKIYGMGQTPDFTEIMAFLGQ